MEFRVWVLGFRGFVFCELGWWVLGFQLANNWSAPRSSLENLFLTVGTPDFWKTLHATDASKDHASVYVYRYIQTYGKNSLKDVYFVGCGNQSMQAQILKYWDAGELLSHMVVSQNCKIGEGAFLGVHNKDYHILGSALESSYFGKLRNAGCRRVSGECMACGLETCAGPSARRALRLHRFTTYILNKLHPEMPPQ